MAESGAGGVDSGVPKVDVAQKAETSTPIIDAGGSQAPKSFDAGKLQALISGQTTEDALGLLTAENIHKTEQSGPPAPGAEPGQNLNGGLSHEANEPPFAAEPNQQPQEQIADTDNTDANKGKFAKLRGFFRHKPLKTPLIDNLNLTERFQKTDTLATTPEQTNAPAAEQDAAPAQIEQKTQKWEDQAQYHEPSADERAQGAKVEPIKTADTESGEPIDTTETGTPQQDTKADGQDPDTEAVKTPEALKAEQKIRRDEAVAELKAKNPDIDFKNPDLQQVLAIAEEDPTGEKFKELLQADDMIKNATKTVEERTQQIEGITEEQIKQLASGDVKGFAENLRKMADALEKSDKPKDKETAKKMKWWHLMLIALVAAAAVPAVATVAIGSSAGSANK